MKIKQLLKNYPARIFLHDRWLLIGLDGYFYVGCYKKHAQETTDLYAGKSENKAVEALIGIKE